MPPGNAAPRLLIEVEIERLDQLDDVLRTEPDIVLLDNMRLDELRTAVAVRNAVAPHVELEASGGVALETVREMALTGVERISVGALTHTVRWLDVALDWICPPE
jgi:nicotinate-nucleotide pyrophosphorylase (carboxylating)